MSDKIDRREESDRRVKAAIENDMAKIKAMDNQNVIFCLENGRLCVYCGEKKFDLIEYIKQDAAFKDILGL